jgi:hypothetical protein
MAGAADKEAKFHHRDRFLLNGTGALSLIADFYKPGVGEWQSLPSDAAPAAALPQTSSDERGGMGAGDGAHSRRSAQLSGSTFTIAAP